MHKYSERPFMLLLVSYYCNYVILYRYLWYRLILSRLLLNGACGHYFFFPSRSLSSSDHGRSRACTEVPHYKHLFARCLILDHVIISLMRVFVNFNHASV